MRDVRNPKAALSGLYYVPSALPYDLPRDVRNRKAALSGLYYVPSAIPYDYK